MCIDIPDFNLESRYTYESPPQSPTQTVSSTGANTSGPSSRRTSISSVGFSTPNNNGSGGGGVSVSGSVSGSSLRSAGSGASSRSTSFNLPDEARKGIRADGGDRGEEVEEEEEMDEEGMCWVCCLFLGIDVFLLFLFCGLAAAKHAAFIRARGRHYSNEAEAMKVRVYIF